MKTKRTAAIDAVAAPIDVLVEETVTTIEKRTVDEEPSKDPAPAAVHIKGVRHVLIRTTSDGEPVYRKS